MKHKALIFFATLLLSPAFASLCLADDASAIIENCNCGKQQKSHHASDKNTVLVSTNYGEANSTTLEGGAQGNLIQAQVQQQGGPVNILFLLDASLSMKEHLSGSDVKMETAKSVLQDALTRIPTDVNVGLRVFGQSYSGDPYSDCQQTALLVPLGQGNRRTIIERIAPIHPFGLTPLTYSLMMAERDLSRVDGSKTLILITDGAETCGGNPCQYISRLKQSGVNLKVDIVGLGLHRDKSARNQLNCIANASGGKYYDAGTAEELIESISRSVSAAVSGRVIMTHPQTVPPSSGTPAPPK